MHEDVWYNIMNNNSGGDNVFSTSWIIIIKNVVSTQHDGRYRYNNTVSATSAPY